MIRAAQPIPPVAEPARPAFPADLPTSAAALVKAVVEPWRVRAYRAVGPTTYTWRVDLEDGRYEQHAGGWRDVASAWVRVEHPDGRAAVAWWAADKVKAIKGEYGTAWAPVGAWRWRWCACRGRAPHPSDLPAPIGLLALRRAVADPTHHTTPMEIAA